MVSSVSYTHLVQMYYTDAQVAATALASRTSQMREGTIRKCDMEVRAVAAT